MKFFFVNFLAALSASTVSARLGSPQAEVIEFTPTKTWASAKSFCQNQGLRLPTLEELCDPSMRGEENGQDFVVWAAVMVPDGKGAVLDGKRANTWIQVGGNRPASSCKIRHVGHNPGYAPTPFTQYCVDDDDSRIVQPEENDPDDTQAEETGRVRTSQSVYMIR